MNAYARTLLVALVAIYAASVVLYTLLVWGTGSDLGDYVGTILLAAAIPVVVGAAGVLVQSRMRRKG